ncbi:MAG: hypothetical protein AUI53_05955 [Acidobacteria bacterium 13_1_40CM_2_60_7]|nr:MAG: hypothetical protein AUI53_05955 [Acidobacteria bacterium 13_1_40CM_2_60_7]
MSKARRAEEGAEVAGWWRLPGDLTAFKLWDGKDRVPVQIMVALARLVPFQLYGGISVSSAFERSRKASA